MKSSYHKILGILDKWMDFFDWEPEHMRHVSRLSVKLFDQLKSLHQLSDQDRFLLQAGALVHDVGFPQDEANHHKISQRLILDKTFPGLEERQRSIIALLARYHRKGKPKKKHKLFAALESGDQERVRKLAALLRIADGLDRSHTQNIQNLDCKIGDHSITISFSSFHNPFEELYAVRKKASLFEEVFHKKLMFQCV